MSTLRLRTYALHGVVHLRKISHFSVKQRASASKWDRTVSTKIIRIATSKQVSQKQFQSPESLKMSAISKISNKIGIHSQIEIIPMFPQIPRTINKHSLCATQFHAHFWESKSACYACLCLPPRRPRRSLPASVLPQAVSQLRWGVVQLVGHLTVNEDGEGSNPSAPAKIPQ